MLFQMVCVNSSFTEYFFFSFTLTIGKTTTYLFTSCVYEHFHSRSYQPLSVWMPRVWLRDKYIRFTKQKILYTVQSIFFFFFSFLPRWSINFCRSFLDLFPKQDIPVLYSLLIYWFYIYLIVYTVLSYKESIYYLQNLNLRILYSPVSCYSRLLYVHRW